MDTIEIILMTVFAICFFIFFTLWYRKREDYIELLGSYKAVSNDRDYYCEAAKIRLEKIDELRKRLNVIPMVPYNVTRIESYQQPIKEIKHIVEINPYDFSHMSDASIADLVKKELFKHIFEAAEPLVEVIVEDCPLEPSRKFMGRIRVVEPLKEEK